MVKIRRLCAVLPLVVLIVSMPASVMAADPVQSAIQWLHAQQLPDGSFGRTQPSAAITSDVVYALALAGENPAGFAWTVGGKSALTALATLTPAYVGTDAGQAGKVARAAAAAGANPRDFGGVDLIAIIENAYDPATGRYHPSFLFRHSLAVEALQQSELPVPVAALHALRSAQLSDGGWFWAFAGTQADVDTTGFVLRVLARESQGGCNIGFIRAASYLARAQTITGGWAVNAPPSTSSVNANSTGLAVGGLRAIGRNPDAAPYIKGGHGGLQALLSFQEMSGAFVYINEPGKEEVRLTATADALTGLLQSERIADACPKLYLPVLLAR